MSIRQISIITLLTFIGGCGGGSTSSDTTSTNASPDAAADTQSQPSQTVVHTSGDSQNKVVTIFDKASATPIEEQTDDDADGTVDQREFRQFDDNKCHTQLERLDANDIIVARTVWLRNTDCKFTRLEDDRDTSGVDGIIDFAKEQDFENGNLIQIRNDTGADDLFESFEHFSYSATGELSLQESDVNGDGVIDSIRSYDYNNDGRVSEERYDSDADGNADSSISFSYTDLGAAGFERISSRDDNGDGTTDSTHFAVIDAQGRELRFVTGYLNNGSHTGQERLRDYTSDGLLERYRLDTDGDGVHEQERTYNYNSEGNPLQIQIFQDGDLILDSVYTYQNWTIGQIKQ
jgi:hypothetical protein